MCDFVSWIEKDGGVFLLDNDDLSSKRGRELKEYLGSAYDEDKKGHGAIEWFYGLSNGGVHKECGDFSSPENFHKNIVAKIKEGKLSLAGKPHYPEQMLNKYGLKKLADWQKANADWQKANADWKKAYADWQKAYADRKKADADLQKADADWQKACADWKKAYADWQKAYADRKKADAKVFWDVFADKKNRVKCWR